MGADRPFPPDRALRLRPIARVLQHALALRKQVSIARTDNERIYGMLDALNDGIMLLDKSALVRYVNPKAIALLKRQESVSILHGVFSMLRPERNQAMQLQLREAMSASLHPTANSRNRVIILETHSEKDKLLLTLTPLRRLTPFRALLADGVAALLPDLPREPVAAALAGELRTEAIGPEARLDRATLFRLFTAWRRATGRESGYDPSLRPEEIRALVLSLPENGGAPAGR